ncbi:hypothetical protein C7974DRAFT_439845 [Boeremia exigua]|uniref:uncharacterized protein n=1 Tax=Boeremia exigua TaxID=749465 RepID=UPI001E8D3434|nr:uncharacterized protein C7974DRAFT_439845 [Boeremia exigua]KAH6644478.1 hypothetical protein C7974DRAFT_439845 [Boeremia exigua]
MPLSDLAVSSLPVISPVPDISRYSLKQISRWIRDDLDVRVAREGPDTLRPDDVVALHELFTALRHFTTISVRDLRATGIHKAIKDISGIATRWPGRLCDDCDAIVNIWTIKFGPLDELYPFLYGRGGRLEGIASVSEHNREALLKRWSQFCPDKIDPRVSHSRGSLGFRAGDWWINPLFAHHAGIIGLESVEGGTTYDKNGAYALVLKRASEVDARDEYGFTYRCPINDKGRFRLTAATARSRAPIRVLRAQGVNSVWGPKAGIRYEGLYSVKGWRIRQANLKDTVSGDWEHGDILYEISLQRNDSVSMDEVTKRPTNMELDDYTEYKRLRRLYREGKHTGLVLSTSPRMAPRLPPIDISPSPTSAPQSLLRLSPSLLRRPTFRSPDFDDISVSRSSLNSVAISISHVVSPMTVPSPQSSFFMLPDAISTKVNNGSLPDSSNDESTSTILAEKPVGKSIASSTRSTIDDLKEIIPWIELEPQISTPLSPSPTVGISQQSTSKSTDRLEAKAAALNPVKTVRRLARDSGHQFDLDLQSRELREQDAATNGLNLRIYPAKPIFSKKNEEEQQKASNSLNLRLYAAKPIFSKILEKHKQGSTNKAVVGKKPKFFDGAGYSADEEDDDCRTSPPKIQQSRPSSVTRTSRVHSPTPIKPQGQPRFISYGTEDIEFASDRMSRTGAVSPAYSFRSSPTMSPRGRQNARESIALGKLKRWLSR